MKSKSPTKDGYILLENTSGAAALLPFQQQRLEAALLAALQSSSARVMPSSLFVADLERELVRAAQRRQRLWYWLGAAGGGVLSLIGGVLLWYYFWRKPPAPSWPLLQRRSKLQERSAVRRLPQRSAGELLC